MLGRTAGSNRSVPAPRHLFKSTVKMQEIRKPRKRRAALIIPLVKNVQRINLDYIEKQKRVRIVRLKLDTSHVSNPVK